MRKLTDLSPVCWDLSAGRCSVARLLTARWGLFSASNSPEVQLTPHGLRSSAWVWSDMGADPLGFPKRLLLIQKDRLQHFSLLQAASEGVVSHLSPCYSCLPGCSF